LVSTPKPVPGVTRSCPLSCSLYPPWTDKSRDDRAWEHAQALAKDVVDDPRNALARAVLEGGPFAMRKAEELAELVLSGDAQAVADIG
jgi:hypothetical protein